MNPYLVKSIGVCLTVALVLLGCASRATTAASHEAYEMLLKDVVNRSVVVHKIPPGINATSAEPFTISIRLFVIDVLDIDQIGELMSLVVFFHVSWLQSTLCWNKEEFDNITSLQIDSKGAWLPRIFVLVGDRDSIKLDNAETINLRNDGLSYFENFQQISFRCDIAFEHYPFDSQNCSFGLYELSDYHMVAATDFNFSLDDVYRISGEWSLRARSYSMVRSERLMTFPRYSFAVRRHSTYYVITIIFPMVLTSVLIPLVFLIPAYTGEKISYLIAIFTSTAVFLNFISDVMPRGLSSMPYLAMLLVEVMLEGLCAILASLWIINRFEREEKQRKFMKKKTATIRTACCCVPKDVSEDQPGDQQDTISGRMWVNSLSSRQQDNVCLAVFGIGQIAFLTVLFGFTDWVSVS